MDGDASSALVPASSMALAPLSSSNAALLDSYILAQSPVFNFLAQNLESNLIPEFDHSWHVGVGDNALEVTATWEPGPGDSVEGPGELERILREKMRTSSRKSGEQNDDDPRHDRPPPQSPTPSGVSSSSLFSSASAASKKRSSWTITPLLLPQQRKVDKKSLRARLRQRHLQRLKTQLTSSSSTTSLPALTSSLNASSNGSTDDLYPPTGSAAWRRLTAASPTLSELSDAGSVDGLRGVVADQLEKGSDLKGRVDSSFAAVIRLQESIYLLRKRVVASPRDGMKKHLVANGKQ